MKRSAIFAIAAGLALLGSVSNAQSKGDAAKGKTVFDQCAVCHSPDGSEEKMGPSLKGLFKRATFKDGKTKITETTVRKRIDEGTSTGMPAYADMLDKAEKDDLIAYLKTL